MTYPPYKLTPALMALATEISRKLGRIEGATLIAPQPKLRKSNRIKTIKSTLAIEGNTFTEEQITAIFDKKRVLGSKKEILEVQNAIALYEGMDRFYPSSLKDFLKAHGVLMKGLLPHPGRLRSKNVGILKGSQVKHVAPPGSLIPELAQKLFHWIKNEKNLHPLILSCIAHYEIEFIHPFEDGNGRMGRFWQSLILTQHDPMFKYIPTESLIEKNQKKYYQTLELCDKAGDSTAFILFMLKIINQAIDAFSSQLSGAVITPHDRLDQAKAHFGHSLFTRKDYMLLFKTISTATASRDLKAGVEQKLLKSSGRKNQMQYRFV